MFDFDAGKLLIVGVIALLFIPPKDLPRVLRQVGQFVGRMRRMAAEFQGQFMDAMRDADMAALRKEAEDLADAARIETRFPAMHDIGKDVMNSIEVKPVVTSEPAADAQAFEALRSELRPLVEEPDGVTHADSTELAAGHAPHSA